MDIDQFWDIIDRACHADPSQVDDWGDALVALLSELQADEIVEWNHIFDDLARQAYTVDLWGAAYLMNGGASHDGFYYFRCWLIGMGRDVYGAALTNPDTLARITLPFEHDAEAEIYAAAHAAWMQVTGRPDTDPYPARNESADLRGQSWDFNSNAEVRRRFPRLATIYLDPDEDANGCTDLDFGSPR